ncbi:MAG TPA: hypothetical protein VJP86_11515 [Vicinamibacterales bacterium]|jgi:hypothetical protein|nr:hypothetical protein [Vicinamibacterales bacterium]
MADFTVRSDAVNVEQIMERIRARIAEKRGVDYTEQQIRELAAVKLEKFLDPKSVRSDLLQQFQRMQAERAAGASNVTFGPNAIFEAQRPIVARIRRLLHPVLRLFFNPDPISQALVRLNDIDPRADMYYELFHNLVIELTRASIEIKNLKMKVESLTGRLEFNERRARALESVVVYKPSQDDVAASVPSRHLQAQTAGGQSPQAGDHTSNVAPGAAPQEGPGQRSRRRRRRRGRRGGSSATALLGGTPSQPAPPSDEPSSAADIDDSGDDFVEGGEPPDVPGEPESHNDQ